MMPPRILIAGIGNIFLGDDGFGVEAARRLARRALPPGVRVADFGTRGLDLAFALSDGCDAAILIDAAPRGGAPGTLYVLKLPRPATSDGSATEFDPHGMDPLRVLDLAAALGGAPELMFLVGCEPTPVDSDAGPAPGLTPPVEAALGAAADAAMSLAHRIIAGAFSPVAAPPP